MQGSVVPIVGNRLEFVGSFRIYVTARGELVIPVGNCRVYVEDEQARDFLNDLLALAGRFRQQPASGNGLGTSSIR
jgi:hypothetical protein